MSVFLPRFAAEDVEQTLKAGVKLLRFPLLLERQFEADTGDERRRKMIWVNCIGLVIYHSFLLVDPLVVADVFRLDLKIHFLATTPIIIGINVALGRRIPFWLIEILPISGVIFLAATIVWVVADSRSPDRDLLLSTLSLVLVFAIAAQRIRFYYMLAGSAVLYALYVYGLTTGNDYSTGRLTMASCVFGAELLFFLMACYRLEYEERRNYLFTLRDRFHRRDLELVSLRDPLTGVGNRRALDAAMQQIRGSCAGQPARWIGILLLDIDLFKIYNDTNGHQDGDACLKRVAAIVAASLPAGGEVYRFGGEEFLIVLQPSTAADALREAERIRLAVADAGIPSAPSATSVVTVSIGVAVGRLSGEQSPDHLVSAADAALYSAKRNGRNQVSHAPKDEAPRPTAERVAA